MSFVRFASIACVVAMTAGAPAVALAQQPPSEADKAVAQALFDAARKLTAEKKWAEACPKLAESERLDPSLGTEYYLADCYEQMGRIATAQIHFYEVAAKARAVGQMDRAEFAKKRADALGPRIPKLVVNTSPAAKATPGLAITRDGAVVSEVQLGVPISVEMGNHTIIATGEGGKRWEKTISITKEGETVTVTIEALRGSAAAPPPPALAPHAPLTPPPPAAKRGMSPLRIAGLAITGAGVVGLGVGAAFGAIAMSKNGASNEGGHCDAQSFCDATGKQARLDALSAANVSTAGFIAGGVAAAAGVILIVVGKSPSAPQTALDIGPGRLAITGRF